MADPAIVVLPDEFRGARARCRECGAKLPLLRRLANACFCSEAHERLFEEKQERMQLERLQAFPQS